MRWLLFLLLALAGCQAGTMPPALGPSSYDERAFMQGLVNITPQVSAACEDGNWTGSSVYMGLSSEGIVAATAAHVAEPGCLLTVGGLPATILDRDEDADVALLLVESANSVPQLYLSERAYLGMPVIVVGYPGQLYDGKTHLQVTRGALSAFLDGRWKFDAPIRPGSSGGPVFDGDGRLVGLAVEGIFLGSRYQVDGEYFLTPADRLFEMYLDL